MVIFGIDPGTALTGYGVVKVANNSVSFLDAGVIGTSTNLHLSDRLESIYDKLCEKMSLYKPSRVCIEEAFYGKNVHTTLVLGHARGVAMLAARKSGAAVLEYSPREIKKAVTGNGNASKEQVAYMVKMILPNVGVHEKTDTYDALAVALCDFNRAGCAALGIR